jgi:ribokinase
MDQGPGIVGCLGSSSIDLFVRAVRLPNLGETCLGTSFAKAFGGKGANQAAQCALLGSRVSFVGRVGDTSEGRDILGNFGRLGIDCSYVSSQDAVAAGVALIEVEEKTGKNRILVVAGANALVSKTDLTGLSQSMRGPPLCTCSCGGG